MVSAQEKQRLMEQHRNDPSATRAAAAKCGVCIAAVALIAVIGAHGFRTAEGEADSYVAAPTKEPRLSASVAAARWTMEERRTRFERTPASSGAQAASLPTATAEHPPALDEIMLLRRASD